MTIAGTLSLPRARRRAPGRLLPADRPFWAVLAVIAAGVPPWEHALSVEITGTARALALVGLILAARAVYVAIRPGAPIIHALLENAAGVIAYTAIVAPVSYLCARNSRPLINDSLHAVDRWLGYDWQAWADVETGTPAIDLLLKLAYASLLPQMVVALAVLPLIGDGRRGYSLIRGSLIAVLIACAISYATPAGMPEAVGSVWYPDWSALRSGAPFATSLSQVEGVISFPSFHAAMAILLLYSMRGLGVATWLVGVLEALMLLSTPTYGVHYLADVIAGIAVALFAIWLTARLDRRLPVRGAGGAIERRTEPLPG